MRIVQVFLFLCFLHFSYSQDMAFPGAEGFGKFVSGGRGGKLYVVNNLKDEGPGSLREAVEAKERRIVVFSVSGTIELESVLDIKYGNISILGHSAPEGGITLKNYTLKLTDVDNVIIRYLRSRLGDNANYQGDAITVKDCKNIIIDHSSFSWATDECASIYDNENITVQYNIISESLNASVHSKGEHGYGGIWGGMNASFHHNLFAHHKSRNPRFNGARYHKQPEREIVDFRNNVIYNWQENNSYAGEEGNYNIVNNYYKPGPASESKLDKILDPYDPYGKFYIRGNVLIGDEEVTKDNWKGVKNFKNAPEMKLDRQIDVASIYTETADVAFSSVLKSAGASYSRDPIDIRVVREALEGTATFAKGIIDSQSEVGGWPDVQKGRPFKDWDVDGMPDEWEIQNGLNPENPDDAMSRTLDPYYSNIETYVNSLIPIPRDLSYTRESTLEKLKKYHSNISLPNVIPGRSMKIERDRVYRKIGNRELFADVYYSTLNVKRPGILLVHGGGWRAGDRSLMKDLAVKLSESGFSVIVPEYRMSLEAPFPAAVDDIRQSIQWFKLNAENFNLDKRKLAIIGFSAGGELAALVGNTTLSDLFSKSGIKTSIEVHAIIDVDGVLKFRHPDSSEGGMAAAWLGGNYDDISESWENASPLNFVHPKSPPTLFIKSMHERFLAGHKEYMEKMSTYGIKSEKVIMEDAPHSFWLLNPWFERTIDEILKFLNSTL